MMVDREARWDKCLRFSLCFLVHKLFLRCYDTSCHSRPPETSPSEEPAKVNPASRAAEPPAGPQTYRYRTPGPPPRSRVAGAVNGIPWMVWLLAEATPTELPADACASHKRSDAGFLREWEWRVGGMLKGQ